MRIPLIGMVWHTDRHDSCICAFCWPPLIQISLLKSVPKIHTYLEHPNKLVRISMIEGFVDFKRVYLRRIHLSLFMSLMIFTTFLDSFSCPEDENSPLLFLTIVSRYLTCPIRCNCQTSAHAYFGYFPRQYLS